MSKSIKEIAEIAANWWADQLVRPTYDNGDRSTTGGFGMLLAMANTKEVTPEAKQKFVDSLTSEITKCLESGKDPYLHVDYGPTPMLGEAAEQAEISTMNFPWKTSMWMDKEHVSVSLGYRAPREYLYASPEHWQKQIKSLEEAIHEYKNGRMSLSWYEPEEREKVRAERITECEELIEEYKVKLAEVEKEEELQERVNSIGAAGQISELIHNCKEED